jgi:RNA polymerase sigma-70 factor (ECF subfamily)
MQAALMTVSPDYRAVIILKHLLGFSYQEIGEVLEIPEKKVKSRLFTARKLLQETLTERGLH